MLTLRAASGDDVDSIAELWHRGWLDGHQGNVPPALLRHRERDSFQHRYEKRVY